MMSTGGFHPPLHLRGYFVSCQAVYVLQWHRRGQIGERFSSAYRFSSNNKRKLSPPLHNGSVSSGWLNSESIQIIISALWIYILISPPPPVHLLSPQDNPRPIHSTPLNQSPVTYKKGSSTPPPPPLFPNFVTQVVCFGGAVLFIVSFCTSIEKCPTQKTI